MTEEISAKDRAVRKGWRLEEAERDAAEIASLVRPLPDDVLPSPRFLDSLRQRLLTLPGSRRPLRAA